MLTPKTIQVEKEVSDVMSELVTIVTKVKSGETVLEVFSQEIANLIRLVGELNALPQDFVESFNGASRAVAIGSVDLVSVLLGKPVAA